jgi:hypothetical protein
MTGVSDRHHEIDRLSIYLARSCLYLTSNNRD